MRQWGGPAEDFPSPYETNGIEGDWAGEATAVAEVRRAIRIPANPAFEVQWIGDRKQFASKSVPTGGGQRRAIRRQTPTEPVHDLICRRRFPRDKTFDIEFLGQVPRENCGLSVERSLDMKGIAQTDRGTQKSAAGIQKVTISIKNHT
jgi:hypothetical protein